MDLSWKNSSDGRTYQTDRLANYVGMSIPKYDQLFLKRNSYPGYSEPTFKVRRIPAPSDLAIALQEAGINEPAIDGYGSGEPLRFTTIGGKPVVYSLGPDGNDDQGLKEWTHDPKHPGDWTFRMESGEEAERRRQAARRANRQ
jgi:hypothetical protein